MLMHRVCLALVAPIMLSGCLSDLLPGSDDSATEIGSSRAVSTPATVDGTLPDVAGRNDVLIWNEAFLASVRAGEPKPTIVTRAMFMIHSAIFDAWAAYDADAVGSRYGGNLRQPAEEWTDENKRIAIAHAAVRTASVVFPQHRSRFVTTARELGVAIDPDSIDPATPQGIGNLAAMAVVAARENDGSNWQAGYADTSGYVAQNAADPDAPFGPAFDPNRWQPLRVPTGTMNDEFGNPVVAQSQRSYSDQRPVTPHWNQVAPFALAGAGQFRPVAPPQYGSSLPYVDALGRQTTNDQAWQEQFRELIAISARLESLDIGPLWKCVAEFWADGPRSETPPGHWNQLAQGFVRRDALSLDDTVKLYFALNAALHDAAIATWDAKYHFDYIRPLSAIRFAWGDELIRAWAGPNRGVQTIPGGRWQPYQESTFVTPAFPEYVSGHSAFSMAAAAVLIAATGSDRFYDPSDPIAIGLDLDDEPGPDILGRHVIMGLRFEEYDGAPVVLTWPTITAAAEEAGMSRLYGGIHIQDGNLRGQDIGRDVGRQAYALAERYFDGTAAIADPLPRPSQ